MSRLTVNSTSLGDLKTVEKSSFTKAEYQKIQLVYRNKYYA